MAIDLDALTNETNLPTVKLFGSEFVVHPMTGAAAHKIAMVQEGEESNVKMLGALLDVVRSSVPGLTAEQVDRLSIEQIGALIQLSRGQIAEVEEMLADSTSEQAEKN